jgi:hypothetical protein
MELVCGRLEEVSQEFQQLSEAVDEMSKSLPPQQAEQIQNRMRNFEYHKCVLEGNYTRAGVLWEQLNGNGRFPKVREEDKAKLFVFTPEFKPELPAAAVLGGPSIVPVNGEGPLSSLFSTFARQSAVQIVATIQTECNYHHVRGLLFLIEGMMGEARKQLALAPAPQGKTPIPWAWAWLDEQYVRMIDAAAKK